MADIENILTWSHSRQGTFDSCRRKYYYTYYGNWGGWEDNAPGDIRLAYCLKNMDGVDAYIGTVVHRHITEVCTAVSKARAYNPNVCAAIEREMDQAFLQSKHGNWKSDPKRNVRFFEDHYRDGFTREEQQAKKEKAVKCMRSFLDSKFFKDLEQNAGRVQWVWIDPPKYDVRTQFSVNGFKAYGKLDLAFRFGDKFYIVDFKTGKASESEAEQIGVYALYARAWWQVDPEKLTCGVISLFPEYDKRPYHVTEQTLVDTEQRIKDGYAEMKMLHQPGLDYDREAFLACTSKCDWCNFKEMCG